MPRHTAKRQFICHTTGQNKSSVFRQEYTALKSLDTLSEYVYELLNVSGIPFMRSDDNLLSYAHNPEYRAHTVSPTVGRYQDHRRSLRLHGSLSPLSSALHRPPDGTAALYSVRQCEQPAMQGLTIQHLSGPCIFAYAFSSCSHSSSPAKIQSFASISA